ncbi:MAG TPA: hypothetical protein VFO44_03420 [Steroidobacteraceae bacterium]|nr:hypothetical protein [Steroidobacteraceae bacterium]
MLNDPNRITSVTPDPKPWPEPSSSKMLTTYLADVEQLLSEQHWEMALRDAFDLPRIAVALTDPQMCVSNERCKAWCEEWIRPASAQEEPGLDPERLSRVLSGHLHPETETTGEGVPSRALWRLRLRRHARTAPSGFPIGKPETQDPEAADAVEICTALVDGVRRWYAHSACHDAVAQTNLARLAVLR